MDLKYVMTICQHMDGGSSLVPAFWITAAGLLPYENKHPNHYEFCEFILRSGQVRPFLSTDLSSLYAPSNPLTLSKTLSSPTLTLTFLDLQGYLAEI